jgi:hypothetical protein
VVVGLPRREDRAEAELGWQPVLPSRRDGCGTALDADPPARPDAFEPATFGCGGRATNDDA